MNKACDSCTHETVCDGVCSVYPRVAGLECTCETCGKEWFAVLAKYAFRIECPVCSDPATLFKWGGYKTMFQSGD